MYVEAELNNEVFVKDIAPGDCFVVDDHGFRELFIRTSVLSSNYYDAVTGVAGGVQCVNLRTGECNYFGVMTLVRPVDTRLTFKIG